MGEEERDKSFFVSEDRTHIHRQVLKFSRSDEIRQNEKEAFFKEDKFHAL